MRVAFGQLRGRKGGREGYQSERDRERDRDREREMRRRATITTARRFCNCQPTTKFQILHTERSLSACRVGCLWKVPFFYSLICHVEYILLSALILVCRDRMWNSVFHVLHIPNR